MGKIVEIIIAKLTSGKFILTMIAGLVFAVLSINKTLPSDKVMEVILIVIYGYFTRSSAKSDNVDKTGGVK